MGLFDLPAPLFAWADQAMSGFAPPTLRLILWGLVAAALSMGLYWLFSPQGKLTHIKMSALAARQKLNAFDGEFAEAWPLMRSMLGLSLKQLAMTTLPAIGASLPVLALIVWLGSAYGYGLPDQQGTLGVHTTPEVEASAEIRTPDTASPHNPPRLVVTDPGGEVISDVSLAAAIPTIHKKQWWNTLIGNPLGYLPDDGKFEAIAFDLPEKDYLGFGPDWLRPWYVLFFTILVIGSLAIKIVGRIE
ncbi:MAG: hypothetical protein R3F54_15950 [Alphaproteobacteria bacterium]